MPFLPGLLLLGNYLRSTSLNSTPLHPFNIWLPVPVSWGNAYTTAHDVDTLMILNAVAISGVGGVCMGGWVYMP